VRRATRRRSSSRRIRGIEASQIATTALAAVFPFGETGLILGLVGICFAVGGAAIDTGFSGAYNIAQFFGEGQAQRRTARYTALDRDVARHVRPRANGPVLRVLRWLYLAVVCVLAVAAPVLLVITNGGGG
jgi:hypothetical protein